MANLKFVSFCLQSISSLHFVYSDLILNRIDNSIIEKFSLILLLWSFWIVSSVRSMKTCENRWVTFLSSPNKVRDRFTKMRLLMISIHSWRGWRVKMRVWMIMRNDIEIFLIQSVNIASCSIILSLNKCRCRQINRSLFKIFWPCIVVD